MRFTTRDTQLRSLDVALLVLPLAKGAEPDQRIRALDDSLGGAISRLLERRDFRAARDETIHLVGGTKGPQRILIVGMGVVADPPVALRRAAMVAARFARRTGAREIGWYHGDGTGGVESVVVGLSMGAWEYSETKTPPPDEERRDVPDEAIVVVSEEKRAKPEVESGMAISEGVALARRLAMMPGNLCTPDYLADTAHDIGRRFGAGVTVLGRAEMEREGMGSFLCVAQGTSEDPKLIALEYKRGKPDAAPVILVGKGLCFDTG